MTMRMLGKTLLVALALLAAALWRARRRALVGDAVRPPA
jgi:hypothetical protein